MDKKLKCTSCKKEIINTTGSVKFNCPGCGKEEIVRCVDCRKLGTKYQCKSCNFSGPN